MTLGASKLQRAECWQAMLTAMCGLKCIHCLVQDIGKLCLAFGTCEVCLESGPIVYCTTLWIKSLIAWEIALSSQPQATCSSSSIQTCCYKFVRCPLLYRAGAAAGSHCSESC